MSFAAGQVSLRIWCSSGSHLLLIFPLGLGSAKLFEGRLSDDD
jgi:hypothetical protein